MKGPDTANIPVIDVANPSTEVAKELLNAASTHGFVFISNDSDDAGIPPKDIQGMFELSREFFKSPTELKAECPIQGNHGWAGMHVETLDPKHQKKGDFKEAFNIGDFANGKATQPLPSPLSPHEAQIGRFADQCHALCNNILRVFATALEGGASWFAQRHDRTRGPSSNILRLLYYPALSPSAVQVPSTDIRAGAHSDYGTLTLLFQLPGGQPGLEILTPADTWAPVPINPLHQRTPPILVNIGDLLSYWTGGLLKSTVHRVVFPKDEGGADRYSMAYFCHPLDAAELVPIPSKLVEGREGLEDGKGGKVLTAKGHLNQRLAETYGIKT
ncbi:Clavaminate synthase-like protein [Saccharata proteae CBS 121410]|uniref:Clavaminate synthase-like protein n=1 Tax=Saccharata proteae CBS 121410 TaxID=1314787 RepID=A0A9P4HVY0_9PEZI|nr:Clavaminate synthase-like protein [Saccharata proteae CBS 121410]